MLFSSNAPRATATSPLSLHDALPILPGRPAGRAGGRAEEGHAAADAGRAAGRRDAPARHGDGGVRRGRADGPAALGDRKSTRLNSSHGYISYAVFCLKKKKKHKNTKW